MNRSELVDHIAQGTSLEKKTVDAVLRGFQSALEDVVAKGDKLTLPGFLTIEVGDRAAREGRNPATGETITIPAAKTVKIKAGTGLKDAANK